MDNKAPSKMNEEAVSPEVVATATSAPTESQPPEPAPAAPAGPEVTTAEEWARRKGMTEKFVPVPAPFVRKGAPKSTALNPLFEKYAAARAHSGWPIGKELTEVEFDAAVEKATTQIYR